MKGCLFKASSLPSSDTDLISEYGATATAVKGWWWDFVSLIDFFLNIERDEFYLHYTGSPR